MNERTNEIVPERRTSDFTPKTIRDFNRVKTAPIPLQMQPDIDTPSSAPVPGVVRRILTPSYALNVATASDGTDAGPALSEPWGEAAAQPGQERRKSSGSPLGITLLSLVGIAAVCGLAFGTYVFGESVGRESVKPAAPREEIKAAAFPAESLPRLDAALQLLRDHDGVGAFQALQNLIAETPGAPSIRYAAAMAAMMADYRNEARRLLEGSISARDRVSDSLALKAAVEGGSGTKSPDVQETLLREAIAADPMNPYPFLELANVLRSQGRAGEAMPVLESARLRLLPADSHAVVNTTLALLALEKTELPEVPEIPVATGIAERDFPVAYALLRRENYDAAAALLSETEKQISPDLFSFLINDPAMRKYARQPALAGLYR